MDQQQAQQRFAAAEVARLATVTPDGRPQLVPIVFALDGDTLFTAIDDKPKRTTRLQRLANLAREPRCAVLVDNYESDWTRLWWVRADGEARIVAEPPADHAGLRRLADRYPAYRERVPPGPLIRIAVTRWSWWSAA